MTSYPPDSVTTWTEPLGASYDDEADVLYLWHGDHPQPAVSYTTDDETIVRVDPETGKIVGFTLLDWAARSERKT